MRLLSHTIHGDGIGKHGIPKDRSGKRVKILYKRS